VAPPSHNVTSPLGWGGGERDGFGSATYTQILLQNDLCSPLFQRSKIEHFFIFPILFNLLTQLGVLNERAEPEPRVFELGSSNI
jgi:hypothetical protein